MASEGNNLVRVNVKSQSGEDNIVLIDRAIAEWMISDECDPASRQAIIDAACNNNNNKVSHVPVNASSPTNQCMEDGPDKSCQGTSEDNNNLLFTIGQRVKKSFSKILEALWTSSSHSQETMMSVGKK
ncbi:hypothetical protein DPMN_027029 [Dreissena polymorpha]|uniref:Uncharacterized protein n=1 Tax=Dreissena polymorpha TaxID=45954 RepID=A0A9D4REV6_DREPO|nr:hypothetical protein DPMN_027029 [Dreissena polymorpha]